MGKGVRQAGPGAREDGQRGHSMGVGGRSRRAAVEGGNLREHRADGLNLLGGRGGHVELGWGYAGGLLPGDAGALGGGVLGE